MTVSVGVASGSVDDLDDFARYLHRADTALYAAKRHGRNGVVSFRTLGDDAPLTARRGRIAKLHRNIA